MPYSYDKLKGRIVEKYGTNSAFAEAMGISDGALSHKLSGRNQFSQKDMARCMKLLDIDPIDMCFYFFN